MVKRKTSKQIRIRFNTKIDRKRFFLKTRSTVVPAKMTPRMLPVA